MKYTDKPDFGPLSNVRVVLAGLSTAGPFAATMMSDFGADVISIESPFVRDQYRTTDSLAYLNKERRNQRAIALNVVKPEGQEAFLKIIESADIFIENSRAGTWDKRGLSDEVLWEHNPKLVICHITGFGLTGDPEYLARGSYDSIGQALSGFMALNGEPDGAPMQAPAYLCDYVVATLASWSCLASYIKAQETGVGESIDCAQYEAMMLFSSCWPMDWFQYRLERKRAGAASPTFAGCGTYQCKDGWLYVFFLSTPTMKKGLPFFGLEFGSELYPEENYAVFKGTEGGDILEEKVRAYCAEHTVLEAEKELNANGITASAVLDYKMMETHPQFVARGNIIEYEGIEGETVKGLSIAPRLKNFPTQIWRRPPHYGEDNEDVLAEAGYTPEQIQDMYDKGLIAKDMHDIDGLYERLKANKEKVEAELDL